jgi:hypothetical protein
LIDASGDALTRLGVRVAAQYLVRPDGYIAFRSAAQTFERLDQHLSEWYVSAR